LNAHMRNEGRLKHHQFKCKFVVKKTTNLQKDKKRK
jgi:hypothetical protein